MWQKLYRRLSAIPARLPVWQRHLRRRRARSIAIVMYHGVTTESLPVFNWNHLQAEVFEQQLDLLSRHYTVLRLSEVIDRLARRAPLPDHTACLTFDDGYRNFHTTAFPLLRRFQMPST